MGKALLRVGALAALLLLVATNVSAELIAHWPMDEGSGDEIEDIVGKGGLGTFAGSPEWVEGKIGGALECSAGNYVTIPANDDLQPTSITATMWVYFNDVAPPRQDFFSKNDDYALSLHEWADNGTIFPVLKTGGGWVVQSGTVKIDAERWYHVALVYDEDSTDLISYIDGEEDARTQAPAGIEHSGGSLSLGTYGGRPLRGILDEVKIWNEALSQADIQADMGGGGKAVSSGGKLATLWGQLKII